MGVGGVDGPTSSPSRGQPLGVARSRNTALISALGVGFPLSLPHFLTPPGVSLGHLPNESPAPRLGLQGRFWEELQPKMHIIIPISHVQWRKSLAKVTQLVSGAARTESGLGPAPLSLVTVWSLLSHQP